MKTLTLLASLVAGTAAAESGSTQPFRGHYLFTAFEHGLPVVVDGRVIGFRSVDHNRNGYWEPEEYQPVFGHQSLDLRMTFDGNGDSRISKREIRAFDDGNGGPDGILIEHR